MIGNDLTFAFRNARRMLAGSALAVLVGASSAIAADVSPATRHFASNGNFEPDGRFAPLAAGFDVADVSSVEALDELPPATVGLLWLGACEGPNDRFRAIASAAIRHPKFFAFYLADDPDPTGRWKKACRPETLRAEADWIHAQRSDALTFVALMNVGSSSSPSYDASLRPEKTSIDLFSVAPYPCRTEWPECRFEIIGRFVNAAINAGFPLKSIVPTFQTFGGGEWRTDSGGAYRMPKPHEMARILEIWSKLAPEPVFDFAYSWGSQRSDAALSGDPALQAIFREHNRR